MIKKLGTFVLIIIVIIVGLKGIRFVRDQLSLKYVKEEINWIENYYTQNAHYPTNQEFSNKFSKIKLIFSSISYYPNFDSSIHNSLQSYSFEYHLSKEINNAIGIPQREMFGYTGRYLVKPCARSISGYYSNHFNTETYTNSDDWIYTDIYSGEVYSVHNSLLNNGKSNEKISLLSGLNKPRIFSWVSPLDNFNFDPSDLNNQVKYKNKVFITNGSDIFSYDWDSSNLKLLNPQKIGEVPQSCSDSISFSENTDIILKEEVVGTFKYDPNGPTPSPLVDKVNMINTKGQVVDKFIDGTFKIVGTNETFKYRERYDSNPRDLVDYNGNSVNDCVTKNCKIIFFIDQTNNLQGRTAIFNDKDNAAVGIINKVVLFSDEKEVSGTYTPNKLGDNAIYSITFTQNGKSGQVTTYSEDLCMGQKGGGFSCRVPRYSKGDSVMFIHDISRGEEHVNGSLFNEKITKAELISYQYSMKPDTGEVFPVVQR